MGVAYRGNMSPGHLFSITRPVHGLGWDMMEKLYWAGTSLFILFFISTLSPIQHYFLPSISP
jgi:hypothetical protein